MADPTSDAEPHKTIESVVSNQIEGQAKVQENDSNIENGRQGRNHFGNKLRILIRSDRVDIFLKVLYFTSLPLSRFTNFIFLLQEILHSSRLYGKIGRNYTHCF
jgi:hypothetical protein